MQQKKPAFHGVWTLVIPCLFSVSLLERGSAQTQCDRSPILVHNTSVWSPVGVPEGLPEFDSPLPSMRWGSTGRQLLRSGVTTGRIYFTSLAAGERIEKDAADPCSTLPLLQLGTDAGSACHFQSGGPRDERAGALEEGGYADFALYSGDAEQSAFDLGRVRADAKAGALFVKDGEWVGPREDSKYVARRRWHASML